MGTALLRACVERALERYRVVRVEAMTWVESEFLLSWYESLGFERAVGLVPLLADSREVLERIST